MSLPAKVDAMARGWGMDPRGAMEGARSGLQAAHWRFDTDARFEVDAVAHGDSHLITPFLTGAVQQELLLDGRPRYTGEMRPGTFNLVRLGEAPRAVMSDAHCDFLQMHVPHHLLGDWVRWETDGREHAIELRPAGLEQDVVINAIGAEIVAEMRADAPFSRLVVDTLAQRLVGHLLRRWSNLGDLRLVAGPRVADWRLRRAIEYIEAHLADDISLLEIAATVAISPRHLSSLFRQALGEAPHQWIVRRRLEHACGLLRRTDLDITEIALACGFATAQHFSTMFRRHAGTTPSAYRRESLP